MQTLNLQSPTADAPAPARKPRKSRGRGLRATTGCTICRKRHMKCDETKPVCGPCAKGARSCVYGVSSVNFDTSGLSDNNRVDGVDTATASGHIASPRHRRSLASSSSASEVNTRARESGSTEIRPPSQQQIVAHIDEALQVTSPQSSYSNSTSYGTEVAPLRWFGLLAGDAAHGSLDAPSLEALGDAALVRSQEAHPEGVAASHRHPTGHSYMGSAEGESFHDPSKVLQANAVPPVLVSLLNGTAKDESQFWRASEPVQLRDHEHDMFNRFVTGVSLWIDLFDPLRHFSTFVPHLALHNVGLMKAILALGARHLSIKPLHSGEANVDRTAAVQYYYETLQYLQSAMQYTSYKMSLELLATVLVVSTYEMIDGAGKGWERHLKGVFWIQRSRDINGESGGLEQAVWWSWLRQDIYCAFREHRRCFSFFKPTKPYHAMDMWDMASRVVYVLAQAVNYSSSEEKQSGERDLANRIMKANTLLNQLDEWRSNISIHFEPLPIESPSNRPFQPIWIHPPALGVSLQMYSMAKILLLIHQPAANGYMEYLGRERIISESIDTIGGVALKLTENAARLISTQTLFAAGLYCSDAAKRDCIADLIREHQSHTGWPANADLAAELYEEWREQNLQG